MRMYMRRKSADCVQLEAPLASSAEQHLGLPQDLMPHRRISWGSEPFDRMSIRSAGATK